MSIWSVLLGLQGFSYDGPQKSIGFDPVWNPENHVSFFTTAEAWGNYMQTRNENEQKSEIKVEYGQLEIEEISIGIANSNIREVLLSMNGKTVKSDWTKSGNVIRLRINNLKLEVDDSIEILMKLGFTESGSETNEFRKELKSGLLAPLFFSVCCVSHDVHYAKPTAKTAA